MNMTDKYVDGFVLPVPAENIDAYKQFSAKAGAIWKEYGALEYIECVADDVKPGKVTSFPQAVKLDARGSRSHQCRRHERLTPENGSAGNAVRRQADVLGWVQGPPCNVRTPHKTASVHGGSTSRYDESARVLTFRRIL